MSHMELLLIEDVPDWGKRGDKITVKRGFARNRLLPFNLAVPATRENVAMVEKRRVHWLAEEARQIEELKELAGHIAKLDLTLVAKAREQTGQLYGSIGVKEIAEAAAGRGIAIDPRHIRLAQPLKVVGDYEVAVRLHEQVQAAIPVHVRMEGREDWLPDRAEPHGETAAPEAGGADPKV